MHNQYPYPFWLKRWLESAQPGSSVSLMSSDDDIALGPALLGEAQQHDSDDDIALPSHAELAGVEQGARATLAMHPALVTLVLG